MKAYQRLSYFCLLITLSLTATGCFQQLAPGSYAGSLAQKSPIGSSTKPVKMEINYPQKKIGVITITDTHNTFLYRVEIFFLDPDTIQVFPKVVGPSPASPLGIEKDYLLLKKFVSKNNGILPKSNAADEVTCFASVFTEKDEEMAQKAAVLCYDSLRFKLRYKDAVHQEKWSLTGDIFASSEPSPMEPPVKMTLASAIDRAIEMNFDSRKGLEHVIQAKRAEVSAYLNLLPRLSTSLLSIPMPSLSSLGSLTSLFPFILPSNWIKIQEAAWEKFVQRDALQIVRANIATSVEVLYYTYERDKNIVKYYRELLNLLKTSRSQFAGNEQAFLSKIAASLESDLEVYDTALKDERYGISFSLAYLNPLAVADTEIGSEEIPIENQGKLVEPIDGVELGQTAEGRSFERRQMEKAYYMLRTNKISMILSLVDFTGDSQSAIGYSILPQLHINQSRHEELDAKKLELIARIHQSAQKVADLYNLSIRRYRDAKSNLAESQTAFEKRLKLAAPSHPAFTALTDAKVETMGPYAPLAASEVLGLATNRLHDLIAREIAIGDFRIARAQKDRLTLSGFYTKLMPDLPNFPPEKAAAEEVTAQEAEQNRLTYEEQLKILEEAGF